MRTKTSLWIALGLVLASASPTLAQGGPAVYTDRHLTERARTLRLDLGPPEWGLNDSGFINGPYGSGYGLRFGQQRVDSDFGDISESTTTLGFGLAYGITDQLEIGANLVPIVADYGLGFDLPGSGDDGEGFGNMTAYVRFAFVDRADLQVGIQGTLSLPTSTDFGLGIGIPINVRLRDRVRLETGVELEAFFGDELSYEPGDDDSFVNLDIPLAITARVARRGFLGGRTGLTLIDLSDRSDVRIPLGAQGGVSLSGSRVAADLKGSFQYFVFSDDDDNARYSAWQLTFGANLFFQL